MILRLAVLTQYRRVTDRQILDDGYLRASSLYHSVARQKVLLTTLQVSEARSDMCEKFARYK